MIYIAMITLALIIIAIGNYVEDKKTALKLTPIVILLVISIAALVMIVKAISTP